MSGKTFAFGREFRVNEVAEVPDSLRGRVRRNRYFEIVEDVPPAPETKEEPEPDEPQNRMLSVNGACEEDDLASLSREELVAKAEEIGVQIDKRWGQARLIQAICDREG